MPTPPVQPRRRGWPTGDDRPGAATARPPRPDGRRGRAGGARARPGARSRRRPRVRPGMVPGPATDPLHPGDEHAGTPRGAQRRGGCRPRLGDRRWTRTGPRPLGHPRPRRRGCCPARGSAVAGTGARRGVVGRCRCRVEPVRPRATGRRPVDRAPRVCRGPAPARGGTARAAGQGAHVVARGGARGLRPGWGQHPGPGSAGRGRCPSRAAPSVGSPRAGLRCRTGGVRRVVAARGDGRGPVVPGRGRRVRGAIRHPARRARLAAERWRVLEPRVAPGCPLDDGRRRDCRRARRAHLHRRGARGTGRAPARCHRPGGRGAGPRLAQRSRPLRPLEHPCPRNPRWRGAAGRAEARRPVGGALRRRSRRAGPRPPGRPPGRTGPGCPRHRSSRRAAALARLGRRRTARRRGRARRPAGRRRGALAGGCRGRSVSCRGRSTAATSGTGGASR